MLVFLGFLIIFSCILIGIGIIWFIVTLVRKGRFRCPIVVFVVGSLLLVSFSFVAYLVTPAYNVTNEQEGENFYQTLISGEDVVGENLTFTVNEVGSSDYIDIVGLGVTSTEDAPITVLLNLNEESEAIQPGDIVTVQINSINSLASLIMLNATLE